MGQQDIERKEHWVCCDKCGKKLIKRQANGLFHFVFGKQKGKDGSLSRKAPVDMLIHGSVKMECLTRECEHSTTINAFPFVHDKGKE